ncbi:methyl-accepting chemotaxis protein [Undibacterium sp. Di24W]
MHDVLRIVNHGDITTKQMAEITVEVNLYSKRMIDTKGIIKGIAFQTDILVLNAVLEAARAVKQSSAFVVECSEVRSVA